PYTDINTLSLHDALPIYKKQTQYHEARTVNAHFEELEHKEKTLHSLRDQGDTYKKKTEQLDQANQAHALLPYENQMEDAAKHEADRKSTRLNSSHVSISY